jgi:hypothetical protein
MEDSHRRATEKEPMNVIIQHRSTRLFLDATGDWVKSKSRAENFGGTIAAIEFCRQHRIVNIDLIVALPDDCYSIRIDPFSNGREHFSWRQPVAV